MIVAILFCLFAVASALTITTPPTNCPQGNTPFWAAQASELEKYNYIEQEYFISGSANLYGYNSSVPFAPYKIIDLNQTIQYTTRIVVRAPNNARLSSGNVILEYLNPTANADAAFVWMDTADEIMRNNHIYVAMTLKPAAFNHAVIMHVGKR